MFSRNVIDRVKPAVAQVEALRFDAVQRASTAAAEDCEPVAGFIH